MSTENDVRTSWQGESVAISCRMVSRYAWTSASIDVAIGDHVILRTGGVLKIVGAHAQQFEYRGSSHTAEVAWGRARRHEFPFTLKIDGQMIAESRVPISNWWCGRWPFAATVMIALLWLILR
jgi:hypothetical protein